MKKIIVIIVCSLTAGISISQTIAQKLQKAWQQFENDEQLKHAISSLYVIDAVTGKVVFDKNSGIGLAPASTQKIITAATAFELLGKDYRYKTIVGYNGKIQENSIVGNLFIKGSGDPTLGSPRWKNTGRNFVLDEINSLFQKLGIKKIAGNVYFDEAGFSVQPLPDGWIWQDLGNYYGAGAWCINWNENQYDLILKSGEKINEPTTILKTDPEMNLYSLVNQIKTAPKGSGDNGYIYMSPYNVSGFTQGTIPAGEDNYTISGSIPYPALQFSSELERAFNEKNISIEKSYKVFMEKIANNRTWPSLDYNLYTHYSPSLDSIVYWFLKKSINLYGEALVKTIAYEKKGFGATDTGVNILKDFWKQKGIDPMELNLYDGSGLSPLNRVTTHAQVEVLKYAKKQSWFNYFYTALPEFNGIKMKSGTISDVKGFCGYQKSKEGKEYIFSFIVNNYNGMPLSLVNKMYKVLDFLK